jgi:hypothetical protein
MNVQLGPGTKYTIERPSSFVGGVYEGLVVGVSGPHGVIRPVSERWPDAHGSFTIVLPASARGKHLRLWENQRQVFSASPARPGGGVDLSTWPHQLGTAVATGVAALDAPR